MQTQIRQSHLVLAASVILGLSSAARADVIFEDGFELGNRSHTENNVAWGNSSDLTAPSTASANSGSWSLRFPYKANTYLQEQRIAFGAQYPELWIKYDLFLPANYKHTDNNGGNNKFFAIFNAGDAFYYNFSLYAGTTPDVVARVNLHYYASGLEGTPVGVANLFRTSDLGAWHRLVMHFKADTGRRDGVAQLWKDGQLIVDLQSVPSVTAAGKQYMDGAYFLGWANSQYAVDTTFYIDDVVVSTSPIPPFEGALPSPPNNVTVE